MSSRTEKALQGLINPSSAALETQVRRVLYKTIKQTQPSSVTTTVAIAETPFGLIDAPQRLVEAHYIPSAAVAATTGHYFTLLVAARLGTTPFTSRNLITFAADTTVTDDIAQWDAKNLMAYATATVADLDVLAGEVVTVAVTKTGTDGMTFPSGTVNLRFRPRDP